MLQWEFNSFFGAFTGYFLASAAFIAYALQGKKAFQRAAIIATGFGFICNSSAIIIRSITAKHLPFANLYEFGMVLVWMLLLFFFYLQFSRREYNWGAFILPIAFLMSGLFLFYYQDARPLMPALKSNWMLIHVASAIVAYGALTVSFIAAALYIWQQRWLQQGKQNSLFQQLPDLEQLESLSQRMIKLAMPLLTLLIITGAIWAEYAWGSYWTWDPKETWSLITWMIYAIYLHGRASLGWKETRSMYWVIAGFIAMLFTLVGVTVLLPGLHSYAS